MSKEERYKSNFQSLLFIVMILSFIIATFSDPPTKANIGGGTLHIISVLLFFIFLIIQIVHRVIIFISKSYKDVSKRYKIETVMLIVIIIFLIITSIG